MKTRIPEPGFDRVLRKVTRGNIARHFQLTPRAVAKWFRVPTERVLGVSQLTGIPADEIRPDLPELFPPP